jgi:hypothetical protein
MSAVMIFCLVLGQVINLANGHNYKTELTRSCALVGPKTEAQTKACDTLK